MDIDYSQNTQDVEMGEEGNMEEEENEENEEEEPDYESHPYDPNEPFNPNLYSSPKFRHEEILGKKQKIFLTLPDHYKITGVIGEGAYGVVCKAMNTNTNKEVAIKVIPGVFSKDREYQKRILRELELLLHFRKHENILSLIDIIPPTNYETFDNVCIVTELLSGDLNKLLKTPYQMNEDNRKYFLYQILRGMKYIHSADVLHRDLKPSNILLSLDMDVKICDFGLARGIDFQNEAAMSTTYVVTRFYRPPELLLCWNNPLKSMDMWGVGCIFAEILQKHPRHAIFKGADDIGQINAILACFGTKAFQEVRGSAPAMKYIKQLPFVKGAGIESLLPPDVNPLALDLLKKLLEINPEKRISAEQALAHPYLQELHDEEEEPALKKTFDFNPEKFSASDMKKYLYHETRKWNLVMNKVWIPPVSNEAPKEPVY